MPHALAQSVEILTTVLTIAGMGYFLAALVAARLFIAARRAPLPAFAPGVSILKSLKGLDPNMIDAFRSHCRQTYAGEYELLFGTSSLDDPAIAAVVQLQLEFPTHSIRHFVCPASLGTNGKVSTLIQLATHARYDYLLINDSDITVSQRYLERVMAQFAPLQPASPSARPPQTLGAPGLDSETWESTNPSSVFHSLPSRLHQNAKRLPLRRHPRPIELRRATHALHKSMRIHLRPRRRPHPVRMRPIA